MQALCAANETAIQFNIFSGIIYADAFTVSALCVCGEKCLPCACEPNLLPCVPNWMMRMRKDREEGGK